MCMHNCSHDRQPQSRSFALGGDERFEDARADLRRYPPSGVANLELERLFGKLASRYDHVSALAREWIECIDGVEQQIEQHLLELNVIPDNGTGILVELELQRDLMDHQVACHQARDGVDHFVDRDVLEDGSVVT